MGRIGSLFGSHPAVRLALAGCLAGLLAGCANSERLADPFGNPFHTASRNPDPTPTGSIAGAAPAQPVQSRPLAAPGAPTNGPVAAYTAPAYPNQRLASAPSYGRSDTTGSVGRPRATVAGWTAEGGMPIVVAQGESAEIVARRYGIPEAALLRTNGFSSAVQVRPGTRLIIPTYNAALAASSGVHVGGRHEVAEHAPEHKEHLRFVKGAAPAVAKDKRSEEKSAKAERHDGRIERVAEKEGKGQYAAAAKLEAKAHGAKIEKVALTETTGPAVEPKKPAVDPMPAVNPQGEGGKTAVAASAPEFRWPARGRIIRGFPGNDGINIALPEGTPVKAAEAGVVAYAGNELKGYGNLVLIRHPNGFVSAYANNAEIDVKRGDVVKRGQVIAKSGQTGNVSTPQLHFELRKGAKPVDPIQYLAGL